MALEQANRFLISQASSSSVACRPETPTGGLAMPAVQVGRRGGGCRWFQPRARGSLSHTLPFLKRVRRSRIQVPALESKNQPQPPARTDCVGLSAGKGTGNGSPSLGRDTDYSQCMGPGDVRTNTGKAAELVAVCQPWEFASYTLVYY